MEQRSFVKFCIYVTVAVCCVFLIHNSFSYSFNSAPCRPTPPHDIEPQRPKTDLFLPRPPKTYINTIPAPQAWATEEQEDVIDDIVRRCTLRNPLSRPKYLFLVLTKDADSWGYNLRHSRRTFSNFLDLLESTTIDFGDVSLGLLTSSQDQYDLFRISTRDLGFAVTNIYLHPGYQDEGVNRGNRHMKSAQFQTTRRGEIARLRNYLMLRSLRDESHIIWLDSDIYELHSPDIIMKMISHTGRSDVGMITARSEIGANQDYDHNAWAGSRAKPAPGARPGLEGDFRHVGELIKGTSDDDLVPLDSVGATILYVRSSLVHQGLTFPDSYAVGTIWSEPGWDGIESEGLCYRAKGLGSGGCWALGGNWYTRHTER